MGLESRRRVCTGALKGVCRYVEYSSLFLVYLYHLTWLAVWEKTFLSVKQFLCWSMDMSWLATVDRDLGTLLVVDHLAVLPGPGLAVSRLPDLAGEGVGHPGVSLRLWFMIPYLLLVLAHDLWHDKVHLLGDQLALLPCHGFTGLGASPHLHINALIMEWLSQCRYYLFSILVSLPVCDTVLLGHILALWHHLDVRHCLGSLLACLLHKQLGGELGPVELLGDHAHGALGEGDHGAGSLHHLSTHIFPPL